MVGSRGRASYQVGRRTYVVLHYGLKCTVKFRRLTEKWSVSLNLSLDLLCRPEGAHQGCSYLCKHGDQPLRYRGWYARAVFPFQRRPSRVIEGYVAVDWFLRPRLLHGNFESGSSTLLVDGSFDLRVYLWQVVDCAQE